MPRYHFGSVDGHREPDTVGYELPDIQAAKVMATRYAGEVLQSEPDLLQEHGQWRVEVTDGDNVLLFTLLTLSLDAPPPPPPRSPSRRLTGR